MTTHHDAAPDGAGHPAVDAVLASLTELDALPVAEHVAVFERAQETLSAALAEAGRDAG